MCQAQRQPLDAVDDPLKAEIKKHCFWFLYRATTIFASIIMIIYDHEKPKDSTTDLLTYR